MDEAYFGQKMEQAYRIYTAEQTVHSPFFAADIILSREGFRHLRYSTKGERKKEEQLTRFTLLPLGLRILKTATTLQEHRKRLRPIGGLANRTGKRR